MTKQLPTDRARRLKAGRCPIHGVFMTQVGADRRGLIAECPRRDCQVRAVEGDDGFTLLPEWEHLLTRESDG
jgi:hypothetical protein